MEQETNQPVENPYDGKSRHELNQAKQQLLSQKLLLDDQLALAHDRYEQARLELHVGKLTDLAMVEERAAELRQVRSAIRRVQNELSLLGLEHDRRKVQPLSKYLLAVIRDTLGQETADKILTEAVRRKRLDEK